ncbi:MAG: hypothetical protein ABL928_08720 [Sphingorhabdus sp.]
MRLLIYLLALMGGFSAADAARAEVAHSSSVAQAAVAVADAMVAQEQQYVSRPASVWPKDVVFAPLYVVATPSNAQTPITRRDASRQ